VRSFASTFQMLRGTLVLFAGLLTIVLLKRRLHIHHWLGMVLIVAGAALVGASSVIFDSNRRPRMEHMTAGGGRRLQFLEVCTWRCFLTLQP
jgi:drug/metabolite transporter (DMT)-like permease